MLICQYILQVGEVNDKLFRDIMKFYRKQPQATSSIYREVFIKVQDNGEKSKLLTYKHIDNCINKQIYIFIFVIIELGDIIQFYNEIYMQKMTPYAWNFSRKQDKPVSN